MLELQSTTKSLTSEIYLKWVYCSQYSPSTTGRHPSYHSYWDPKDCQQNEAQATLTAEWAQDISGRHEQVYAATDFAALIQRINRRLSSPELSIWHLSSTFRLAWAFAFCLLFFLFLITC